jgi:hypothetical protein
MVNRVLVGESQWGKGQTFEEWRSKVILLTRMLGKIGGEVSVITDHYSHDTDIAALDVSEKITCERMRIKIPYENE